MCEALQDQSTSVPITIMLPTMAQLHCNLCNSYITTDKLCDVYKDSTMNVRSVYLLGGMTRHTVMTYTHYAWCSGVSDITFNIPNSSKYYYDCS